jgi:hypothetical protein
MPYEQKLPLPNDTTIILRCVNHFNCERTILIILYLIQTKKTAQNLLHIQNLRQHPVLLQTADYFK